MGPEFGPAFLERRLWGPGSWGGREGTGKGQDLCHVDEVCDDQGPLGSGGLAEDHELDPLRDTVEKGDESLQHRVVHGAAVSHKTVIVLELGAGAASVPGEPLPSPTATPPLQVPCGGYTETSRPPVTPPTPRMLPFWDPSPSPSLHPAPDRRPSGHTRILQKERYSR